MDTGSQYLYMGIRQLGDGLAQGINNYRDRQEKKKKDEAALTFLKKYGPQMGMDTSDDAALKAGIKAVGAEKVIAMAQMGEQYKAQQEKTLKQKALQMKYDALGQYASGAGKGVLSSMAQRQQQKMLQDPTTKASLDLYAATGAVPDADSLSRFMSVTGKSEGPGAPEFIEDPKTGGRFIKYNNTIMPSQGAAGGGAASSTGKLLQDYRDRIQAGDTEGAKAIQEALKYNNMKGVDPAALMDTNRANFQAREEGMNRVVSEADDLMSRIRPRDIGFRGTVQEAMNEYLGQVPGLDKKAVEAQTSANRNHLRLFREGALRLMTDEKGAFSNRDRAVLEQMLPSDKADESYPSFKAKMDTIKSVFSGRATRLAQQLGKKSIFDATPEDIGGLVKAGKMTKEEAKALLLSHYGDKFSE